MLKLLLTGLWVLVVTLGAVYFSVSMATAPLDPAEGEARGAERELVRGESVTVPLIADGAVTGYFLGRLSFLVDRTAFGAASLPLTELITDELFTLLVGDRMVDIGNTGSFDLALFKTRVRDGLNRRFGGEVVTDVLVEQLDYLSKEDIRVNAQSSSLTRQGVRIAESEALPGMPQSGH